MPADTVLETGSLVVGYGGVGLLPPIDTRVTRGQTFFVIGPNGGGKSTFIKTVLGLLPPVSGSLRWADGTRRSYVRQLQGMDLTVRRRVIDVVRSGADVGYSFAKPLYLRSKRRAIQKAMIDCSVSELARAQVGELSEGQRQRVLMARSLASEPSVLVLDEPTSAMDAVNEASIFALMGKLQAARNLTVLLITHRIRELAGLAQGGLLVDSDRGVALGGTLREICESEPFVDRYGPLVLPVEATA